MSCFLQSIRLTVKVISSKSAVVMPMSSGDSVSSVVDVSKTGIGRDVASGEPSLVAFDTPYARNDAREFAHAIRA